MALANDEVFRAARGLAAAFEAIGLAYGAQELRNGLSALNGLTDGWASFLESVRKVEKECDSQLSEPQRAALAAIREAAYEAVYRRKLRWWRFW